MKYNFDTLLTERPEHIGTVQNIEYVENPWRSGQPLIAVNRAEKIAVDSEWFEIDQVGVN